LQKGLYCRQHAADLHQLCRCCCCFHGQAFTICWQHAAQGLLLLLLLAGSTPGPVPALERLLCWGLGALAPTLLLWRRPADVWSLLILQTPLRARRPLQQRLSRLQDSRGLRLALAVAAALSLPLLWWLDEHAAVASSLSPLAGSPRLVALLLAALLLALMLWQWQQLLQALWLLSRSPEAVAAARPMSQQELEEQRLCLGLPLLLLEPLQLAAAPAPPPDSPSTPAMPVSPPTGEREPASRQAASAAADDSAAFSGGAAGSETPGDGDGAAAVTPDPGEPGGSAQPQESAVPAAADAGQAFPPAGSAAAQGPEALDASDLPPRQQPSMQPETASPAAGLARPAEPLEQPEPSGDDTVGTAPAEDGRSLESSRAGEASSGGSADAEPSGSGPASAAQPAAPSAPAADTAAVTAAAGAPPRTAEPAGAPGDGAALAAQPDQVVSQSQDSPPESQSD